MASREEPDLGTSAKRGLFSITFAKLWFMVAGLVLQLALPRKFALGTPEAYGVYALVIGWISTANNVMVTGTIQTIAHFAAKGKAQVEAAKALALHLQGGIGVLASLAFFLLAPAISSFEHDEELTPLLRLAAGILLSYSFYAVFVGAANGARQFQKQAGLDITFSTLRASLVIGAAALFHSPLSAIGGFVAAAAVITFLAIAVVGLPRKAEAEISEPLSARTMAAFFGWLVIYLLCINILLFVDGWLLKRLATESFGLTAEGKRAADSLVGIYSAVQTVARLPYQLILAGAFVVFPVMSAVSENEEETQRYIATTLRFALIATFALVVALGSRPEATMRLLYPPAYVPGAGTLQVLLCAYVLFSLFSIVGTILNGVGRTRATTTLGGVTVLLTILFVYGSLAASLSSKNDPLRATALGMVLGMGAGLALSLGYLYKAFRATFSPLSVLRVLAGCAATVPLSWNWPAAGSAGFLGSKLGTLLCAALSTAVYLLTLFLLGELRLREFLDVRRKRSG